MGHEVGVAVSPWVTPGQSGPVRPRERPDDVESGLYTVSRWIGSLGGRMVFMASRRMRRDRCTAGAPLGVDGPSRHVAGPEDTLP